MSECECEYKYRYPVGSLGGPRPGTVCRAFGINKEIWTRTMGGPSPRSCLHPNGPHGWDARSFALALRVLPFFMLLEVPVPVQYEGDG